MFVLAACLFFSYYKSGRFNNTYSELYDRMELLNNKATRPYETTERLDSGRWYSNKWEMYHTLSFESDKNIVIDNNVDTIFRYKYMLNKDTLWLCINKKDIIPSKIKLYNKKELVFENFLDKKGEVGYSRINNRQK